MSTCYIVGTGPVGASLAAGLSQLGTPVVLVSRSPERVSVPPGIRFLAFESVPAQEARVIIAVPDDAIEEVSARLAADARPEIVLHTAGCRGVEALASLDSVGCCCGVLHPLVSLPAADAGALRRAWFAVSGRPRARRWARQLVELWEGRLIAVDSGAEALYHAAAATASNHLVALMGAAEDLLVDSGVDRAVARRALASLARRSLDQVRDRGPAAALTGPIRRGDSGTVERHLEALRRHPVQLDAYRSSARLALELARSAGLAEEPMRRLDGVLGRVDSIQGKV